MKTIFKLILPFLIILLLSFDSLKSQTYEFNFEAEKGLLNEIYIFNGVFYELYKTEMLRPSEIKVSSTLKSKSGRYQKSHLLDNKLKTAWVEGVKGNGIGQKIRFTFENNNAPDVISFVPGYMSSKETWYKNNRVSEFKVRVLTADNSEEPNETIDEFTVTMPKDSKGKVDFNTYSVNISSVYLQNMTAEFFGIIEIEILEVDSKDAVYEDTCISEITFYIHDEVMKSQISIEEYQKMTENN